MHEPPSSELSRPNNNGRESASKHPVDGLHEIATVKEFGAVMQQRRLWHWWRKGMGYEASDGEL
jgi:hypothetical protein